jgi:hypothetical protein
VLFFYIIVRDNYFPTNSDFFVLKKPLNILFDTSEVHFNLLPFTKKAIQNSQLR